MANIRIFKAILCVSTDCQGSQDISLIMDVYRLALKVNYYYFNIKFTENLRITLVFFVAGTI